ncbi:MAG: 1-hydroxycarotenoid 3,4-desaturase CrtD [Fluviicola sp.]
MKENKKAVVVGSGIAGIASALRLRKLGYEVDVYEKNSYLGGKLTRIQLGKYAFDAGPSLFTLPNLVTELFELYEKNPTDYFNYQQIPTCAHYFFEDGTFLRFYADKKKLQDEVREKLNTDPQQLVDYLDKREFIYNKTERVFLKNSLHRLKNFLHFYVLKAVISIPRLHLFQSMNKVNEKAFTHPKLVQIFNRYATYNGSNPYKAPGILTMIPHLEMTLGTYFPIKGMHAIPMSLIQLAQEQGVRFHTNAEVQGILVENKTLQGIQVNDTQIQADVVFCNSDVKSAYSELLPTEKKPKKALSQEPSSSAMIFYWGIKKKFDNLDLHNLFYSDDYETEFEHIFSRKTISDDPTVYVHISSKLEFCKEDAPEYGDNWFVMVNVPHDQGQDWETERIRIRKLILEKLSRMLGESIEELIEEEDYLDPLRIESRTKSRYGSLYGTSSNDRMAAFFRHPNFSKTKGLYFVGGSVHPGGGIPLCLLSAKIATDDLKD